MDVDLGRLGQVEVDDRRQARDVDAARRDVCGNQELDGVAAHACEGPLTLVLREVAVEHACVEAFSEECLVDAEGGCARVGEDDRAVDALGCKHTKEGLELGAHRRAEGDMLDAACAHFVGGAVDLCGIVEEVGGEPLHILGDGGAAEEGLPVLGQQPRDLADILFKAEGEHFVGLVESEEADLGEAEALALDDVEEATGRGDHDVGVGHKRELLLEGGAAVDRSRLDAAAGAEEVNLPGDLLGELTRRGEHESEHTLRGGLDLLDHRDAEGSCLASAGLGAKDGILARDQNGNGPDLDRGGEVEADLLDREERGLGEAEVAEGGF